MTNSDRDTYISYTGKMTQFLTNCTNLTIEQLKLKNLAISISAMVCFLLTAAILFFTDLLQSLQDGSPKIFSLSDSRHSATFTLHLHGYSATIKLEPWARVVQVAWIHTTMDSHDDLLLCVCDHCILDRKSLQRIEEHHNNQFQFSA